MSRGRRRPFSALPRMLPPASIAATSVTCAVGAWVTDDTATLRGLATAAAAAAAVGAFLLRWWDRSAERYVAELAGEGERAEAAFQERTAELTAEAEQARQQTSALHDRLRAKRTELARLRSEHAALLRRYATAETERAWVLEDRRRLEPGAVPPAEFGSPLDAWPADSRAAWPDWVVDHGTAGGPERGGPAYGQAGYGQAGYAGPGCEGPASEWPASEAAGHEGPAPADGVRQGWSLSDWSAPFHQPLPTAATYALADAALLNLVRNAREQGESAAAEHERFGHEEAAGGGTDAATAPGGGAPRDEWQSLSPEEWQRALRGRAVGQSRGGWQPGQGTSADAEEQSRDHQRPGAAAEQPGPHDQQPGHRPDERSGRPHDQQPGHRPDDGRQVRPRPDAADQPAGPPPGPQQPAAHEPAAQLGSQAAATAPYRASRAAARSSGPEGGFDYFSVKRPRKQRAARTAPASGSHGSAAAPTGSGDSGGSHGATGSGDSEGSGGSGGGDPAGRADTAGRPGGAAGPTGGRAARTLAERAAGNGVIDLTAHDETEPLDVSDLRSAIS